MLHKITAVERRAVLVLATLIVLGVAGLWWLG
jgi:hypothetical protein